MKMKISGLLLGLVLATTFAFAGGSCGAGKCGASMKSETKDEMKDTSTTK